MTRVSVVVREDEGFVDDDLWFVMTVVGQNG